MPGLRVQIPSRASLKKKKEDFMKKPFVYLCTGMSLDGKIATYNKKQSEIATDDDKEMMYECRIKADAIMVGGRTLLSDNPALTVKTEERQNERLKLGKTKEPWKVAVISDATNLKLLGDFFSKGETKKILFVTERTQKEKIENLKKICEVYII